MGAFAALATQSPNYMVQPKEKDVASHKHRNARRKLNVDGEYCTLGNKFWKVTIVVWRSAPHRTTQGPGSPDLLWGRQTRMKGFWEGLPTLTKTCLLCSERQIPSDCEVPRLLGRLRPRSREQATGGKLISFNISEAPVAGTLRDDSQSRRGHAAGVCETLWSVVSFARLHTSQEENWTCWSWLK